MGKLKYCDWVFIENALTYYCIQETRLMEKNPDVYSEEEITDFRSLIKELIDKIKKFREGE